MLRPVLMISLNIPLSLKSQKQARKFYAELGSVSQMDGGTKEFFSVPTQLSFCGLSAVPYWMKGRHVVSTLHTSDSWCIKEPRVHSQLDRWGSEAYKFYGLYDLGLKENTDCLLKGGVQVF